MTAPHLCCEHKRAGNFDYPQSPQRARPRAPYSRLPLLIPRVAKLYQARYHWVPDHAAIHCRQLHGTPGTARGWAPCQECGSPRCDRHPSMKQPKANPFAPLQHGDQNHCPANCSNFRTARMSLDPDVEQWTQGNRSKMQGTHLPPTQCGFQWTYSTEDHNRSHLCIQFPRTEKRYWATVPQLVVAHPNNRGLPQTPVWNTRLVRERAPVLRRAGPQKLGEQPERSIAKTHRHLSKRQTQLHSGEFGTWHWYFVQNTKQPTQNVNYQLFSEFFTRSTASSFSHGNSSTVTVTSVPSGLTKCFVFVSG